MEEFNLIIVFLFVLFFLLGSGVWIAISLIGVAWVGMMLFTDRPVGDAMATTIWGGASSWTLTALPLFIWMGEILFRTKMSENLFKGLSPILWKLPGGLLHVNIAGCTVFAAISGSSAATVATVGKMSIPELRARKYPERMIIGTLAGAGTLGLLIPPSITLIIYGVTVNESIAQLFIAGILPGLMLATLFMGYVATWGVIAKGRNKESLDQKKVGRLKDVGQLIPVFLLIAGVMSSIYLGLATATEAAALGVAGALALSAMQGSLTRDSFVASLLGATRTSAMIAFILAGSTFLSLTMGFTGLPRALAEWIGELQLSPWMLIFALLTFYIILGCFLDGISSVVLTMAVIEPMARSAGFDMIWFGIFLMVAVEMAQITPPVGFNLFVLQDMTGKDMAFISRAALPMFLLMIVAVGILLAFPELATFLPSIMYQR